MKALTTPMLRLVFSNIKWNSDFVRRVANGFKDPNEGIGQPLRYTLVSEVW